MHSPKANRIQTLVFALAFSTAATSSFESPAFVVSPDAFQPILRSYRSPIRTAENNDGRLSSRVRCPFVMRGQKEDSDADTKTESDDWNDEHLAHGAAEIHLETDEQVIEAEDEAAFDAHDLSDPGMEAAALERSLMMAEDLAAKKQKDATESVDAPNDGESRKWNDKHLAHGMADIHIETDEEVEEAEDEVAFDAHDLSDPGMEAAALERSLMMAEEWAAKKKEGATKSSDKDTDANKEWNNEHLAHGASELHIETDEEVEEAEEEITFDAYDSEDAGMEAAALERSLMMAEEWAAKKKKESEGGQKE